MEVKVIFRCEIAILLISRQSGRGPRVEAEIYGQARV